MNPRPLWYIVTPVYKPAPGGGAIYTDILARALADDGADVVVATEAFTGQPSRQRMEIGQGSVTIDRVFPMRAGRAERDWRSYLAYAVQNLRLLGLPRRMAKAARRSGATSVTVLIHSSLFYNRSVMPWVIRGFRRALAGRATLILDVRDYQFPVTQLRRLGEFDRIVTSSSGVADDLRARAPDVSDRVQWIPMPFDGPDPPSDAQVDSVLSRFGLVRGNYLLNPNGVSKDKQFPAMRDAVPLIRGVPGLEQLVLVTTGRKRDWSFIDHRAEAAGCTRYLGLISHADMLALMRGAAATLVLSKREAISRAALEAMWVGGTVILPDVAEFRSDCLEWICMDVTAVGVCSTVCSIRDRAPPRFDFGRHAAASFLPLYRSLEARQDR